MNRKELLALRTGLFTEMVKIMELLTKEGQPIGDGLESLASLRHLYEVTSRELDDADLQVGVEDYIEKLRKILNEIHADRFDPDLVTCHVREADELLSVLQAQGGVA